MQRSSDSLRLEIRAKPELRDLVHQAAAIDGVSASDWIRINLAQLARKQIARHIDWQKSTK